MFPFENFIVYQRAFSLNKEIYSWLLANRGLPSYIRSQLGRASLSVMLNAAEASSRDNLRERRHFLTLSRGSCFECASLLSLLSEVGTLDAQVASTWKRSFDEICRMLYTQIKKLQFAS